VQKAPFRSKVTPLFIAAAADDSLALVANSIELFNEWHAAKRPVELHVYARGGHGLNGPPAAAWVDRFAEWLERLGFFQSGGAKR
jgi:dipeptidyl aminopeptidase/acylaminoacyl peptidase